METEIKSEKSGKNPLKQFKFSIPQQLMLLVFNYIPFFQVALIVVTVSFPWVSLDWRIVAGLAELYLLPPLLVRIVLLILPIKKERIPIPSRDYFVWWFILNLQIIFCRLNFLEEMIRIIPGAYSMWLRLWGSRIGGVTYWAPGLRILDRGFLDIGKGVAFGAGVRLNPHVIAENKEGEMELLLAPIHIGERAIVGGYSLLTAGTRIHADENTRARLLSPPFTEWKDGRKIRKPKQEQDS